MSSTREEKTINSHESTEEKAFYDSFKLQYPLHILSFQNAEPIDACYKRFKSDIDVTYYVFKTREGSEIGVHFSVDCLYDKEKLKSGINIDFINKMLESRTLYQNARKGIPHKIQKYLGLISIDQFVNPTLNLSIKLEQLINNKFKKLYDDPSSPSESDDQDISFISSHFFLFNIHIHDLKIMDPTLADMIQQARITSVKNALIADEKYRNKEAESKLKKLELENEIAEAEAKMKIANYSLQIAEAYAKMASLKTSDKADCKLAEPTKSARSGTLFGS